MKTPHSPRVLKPALITALSIGIVAATLSVNPAFAQEADGLDCDAPADGFRERGEAAALELAAACGTEVLIHDSQDYTSRSFAQPDGTVATEFSVVPQWVPDEDGEWVEADANVVVTDSGIETAATVSDVEFGAEGESAFVTAVNSDGESVSLSWPEPLPEPEVDGATVVYPEVLPQVDLEVYAGVADFSYALVVKTPEAAENPSLQRIELGLATEGLSVAADAGADTAALSDAGGEVAYSVAEPWMWDSSDDGNEVPARAAPMELEMDADSLTVVPDLELLADPEAEFPIYIDPQFRDEGANFANAFSQGTGITCPGGGGSMCTGFQGWSNDAAYGHWRSAMKFNGLQTMANRDIQQATVWITQRHTGDAGSTQTVRLAAMDWFDMNEDITWSDFNDKIVGTVASDSVPTSNTGAGEADQRIQWADSSTAIRIQNLVDNGNSTAVFAALSGANWDQEKNRDYWRKLDPSSAKLVVWHGPLKPTNLYVDGESCSTSAPGPTINTLTPTLKLKAPVALEPNNRVSFYVYERNASHPSALQQIDANDVADGATLTVSVAAGELERGKTYRWNARAWDSDGDSSRYGEFTSYCYFTVNSLPETPTNLSTEGLGCGTESDPTLVTTRSPKLTATPHDPDGGAVELRYLFYEPAGSNIANWYADTLDGRATPSRLASGVAKADGLYRWRAQTFDQFASSANSDFCYLVIDTAAPEPPDVAQVTAEPLPGDPVEFELVGGDGVTGFEYALEGQTRQTVSAADGQTKVIVTPPTSAVDHALQVWAVDAAGNTSSPTTHWLTTIEAQPAEALGAWRFDGDLFDDGGDHALEAVGSEDFTVDRAGRADAALEFDGTPSSCVAADGPIVDSAESATFAAWARPDAENGESQAVLDVTSSVGSSLKLELDGLNRWSLAAKSTDAEGVSWTKAAAADPVSEFGDWMHVAGVYDADAARLRLYVNGRLEDSVAIAAEPGDAIGYFSVGCGVEPDGDTFVRFDGAVDDATVYQQALTEEQITELMTGQGMPAALQAWYPLRGDGADYSGRGADLTAMPEAPVWQADQYGREESALEFDGTTCPTAGTVPVRTDDSFTASAWVWLDPTGSHEHSRVFSFHGAQYFSAMAKYHSGNSGWSFGLTGEDDPEATWASNTLDGSAQLGTWTQLTLVVDRAEEYASLYIDGEFAVGRSLDAISPWRASEFTIGCGGTADGSRYHQWDGAISDVRLWRGALDADEVAAEHVERLSMWELGQVSQETDGWGSNDLVFNGDPSWEVDRWNDCWAAYGLALDGDSWAQTSGPVIATDESFTIATWARLDDLGDYRTIVSQTGTTRGAFNLNYSPVEGRFQLSMPQEDAQSPDWTRITAIDPPAIDESAGLGQWYHLAAQVDLGAGVMRLFVDGELQGEAPVVDSPWRAEGPLTIGAADVLGTMTNRMVGAIDQVQTWSGALDPLTIAGLAAQRPEFEKDPNNAECEDSEEPPVDL